LLAIASPSGKDTSNALPGRQLSSCQIMGIDSLGQTVLQDDWIVIAYSSSCIYTGEFEMIASP
jgi:hypothetical protein